MAAANVQSARGTSASSSTPTRAFGSNVTAGNLICGWIQWDSITITLNSVTDSLGNTYTLKNNPTANTTLSKRAAGFYAENISGGACTLTFTFSSAVTSTQELHEASGVATSASFDVSAAQGQDSPGTGANAVTSTAATTTVNGCYIFGCAGEFSIGGPVNVGTSVAFVDAGTTFNAPGGQQRGEYYIQPSAGSIAATFTIPSDGYTIALMMAFKPPGGGAASWGPLLGMQNNRLVRA